MIDGIPVVISTNGYGVPVVPVDANAPLMTVASNGRGLPIIPVEKNAPPFVIDGYVGLNSYSALSSDDGSNLIDDDEEIMETYGIP